MVLISIHPFAFRKIFLVLLALLGFSALCFADPVLMVRRHTRDNSRVAVALSGRPVTLQLINVTAQTYRGNTTVALEKANALELRATWLCFPTPLDQCAGEAMGDVASAPFL